jgi:RNA polymerase sigma-70 factor (ECF subfamily)
VCRALARDAHLAADASQETFLRLWRGLESGLRPERVGAWLHSVAIGIAIDQRRRATRRAAEPLPEDAGAEAQEDPLVGDELERRYRSALERLSEGQRTVFVLRHEGGLSLAEVAEALDVAPSTVKTQFARAALALQRSLRAFDDSEPRPRR